MNYVNILPVFLWFQLANECPLIPFFGLPLIFCPYLSVLVDTYESKFSLFMRLPTSFGSWKNYLSGLWNVLDMMPSWNGEFSSKSKFGLIFSISVEPCELWGYDTCCLMFEWGSVNWIWMEGSIWDQGLIVVILPFMLFMESIRSLVCTWLFFLFLFWSFQEFSVTSWMVD